MTADREKLIKAMARALYDELEGPVANQDFTRQMRQWDHCKRLAPTALTALCERIPGLSDVLDGKAVIVPLHLDDALVDVADMGLCNANDPTLPSSYVGSMWAAMLDASPYRSGNDGQ